jgi:nicotinamidase-related amidase
MLHIDQTVLLLIDVQERLASVMHEKDQLIDQIQRVVKGCKVLGIPILWMEQYPQGLGPTVPEIAALLPDQQPISKRCFNCCDSASCMEALQATGRQQALLAGIETHVCIYQSAAALVEKGYEVQVVSDAVSSRTTENRQIGLERIKAVGAGLTSVETALFELVRVAEGEQFKEISRIVK